MNKKRTRVFAALVWLLSVTSGWSQVGLTLPTFTNTTNGDVLDLPVRVVNFDTVFSINLVVQWDPKVVQYQSLSFPANPLNLVDSTHFGLSQVSDGIIRLYWYSLTPRTLVDGKDLFHINMKVVGNNGDSTPVKFTELPPVTYFEIVRGPGNQFFTLLNAQVTNGAVSVGTVSADEAVGPVETEASILAWPNPFSEQINLEFDLNTSGETRLVVIDLLGKICYEEKKYLNSGRNGTVIAKFALPAKGSYFVHLFSSKQHAVQPIVHF